MHMAADGGQLEVIKFLFPKFGARVHERDSNGRTMLHFAAQEGHCEVARYLIEEFKMDPQDGNKVWGVPGEEVYLKCGMCVSLTCYTLSPKVLSYPLAKCSGQRGSSTLDLIGVCANCIVLYCMSYVYACVTS